jgi:hypothetical protein
MTIIEISNDTLDSLMRDILVDDYRGLAASISKLRSKENLRDFEKEDLENDIRFFNAMKIILEYYLVQDRYIEVTSETIP